MEFRAATQPLSEGTPTVMIMEPSSTGTLEADGGTDLTHLELTFDRGVPRTLVHKTAVSEVLLTDAVRTGPDRFAVAAQWPRRHVLFEDGMCSAGTVDPLLLLETVRQAGSYVSHVYYDVPLAHPFLLTSIEYEVEPPTPNFAIRQGPHCVLLDVQCVVECRAADRLCMSLEARLVIDGCPEGRVGLCWQAVAPQLYARMRHPEGLVTAPPTGPGTAPAALADPVAAPQVLGRQHDRDAMLAALPAVHGTARPTPRDAWSLRLDTTHPVYFDHAYDHVPGMALAESFAQAAALTSGRLAGIPTGELRWTLESSALSFASFGELGRPVVIVAEPVPEPPEHGRRAIHVSAEQDGRLLAHGALIGLTSGIDGVAR
ncbi:ScbA/BarX family gamma-butyrolactone biosynthesis protein [Streptomyces sp. HK10]|uniref:ScbA/BarX family gamma-butyrolactone biosynthesis protein n=1 Tax=Streptomyces sp. HK10 TaxID=3373255 RepID=UPI003749E6B1